MPKTGSDSLDNLRSAIRFEALGSPVVNRKPWSAVQHQLASTFELDGEIYSVDASTQYTGKLYKKKMGNVTHVSNSKPLN